MTRCPATIIEHIQTVIDYLWEDERNDYQARCEVLGFKPHLFESLTIVQRWLDTRETTIETNRSGVCPRCGKHDGCYNVGPAHWFVCHEHRTKWWSGCNILPTEGDENEAEWEANRRILLRYEEVLSS